MAAGLTATLAAWSLSDQKTLEAAMRAHPAGGEKSRRERWAAIAAATPGFTAQQCVDRARRLNAAVKSTAGSADAAAGSADAAAGASAAPLLLSLQRDMQLAVLELLPGADLVSASRVSRELREVALDDSLWLRMCERALPPSCGYALADRSNEPPWRYCLRLRVALHGMWRRLLEHRAGRTPYLAELGSVVAGGFAPHGGLLPYRLSYGAVAELVQLDVAAAGAARPSAESYASVAALIRRCSPNTRSLLPAMDMAVREIYQACHPRGQALSDEEQRRRLEQKHAFIALVG